MNEDDDIIFGLKQYKIQVGKSIDSMMFIQSLVGEQSGYINTEAGDLAILVPTTDKIGEELGWCRFVRKNYKDKFSYYYLIGEIADELELCESFKFDVPISPFDEHFEHYITQCRKQKVGTFITAKGQVLKVPITEMESLDDWRKIKNQEKPTDERLDFALWVYDQIGLIEEVEKYRDAEFVEKFKSVKRT
jgi:hypothetical protein